MAAARGTTNWRRYVFDSSSDEEGEEETTSNRSLSSSSSSGTEEEILIQPTSATAAMSAATSGIGQDAHARAVGSAVASASGAERATFKSAGAMTQPRRWGDNDLEDSSDSSDGEVFRSLGRRLNETLRLTAPTASTRPVKGEEASHDPLRNSHLVRNRSFDRRQQSIDDDDDVVDELQIRSDDEDAVVLRGSMPASSSSAGFANDGRSRGNRSVRRPARRRLGGYLNDDESWVSSEEDLSSSESEDSVCWEEFNHPGPKPGRRKVDFDERSEAEVINDDFLGMIPAGSAWFYDTKNRNFYLDESDEQKQWPRLSIPKDLFGSLYMHQKSGVEWMAGLHCGRIGGILGDDMGMGKTYMTLTYLFSLMRCKTIRNGLIVVPMSVLRSWEREASKVKRLGSLKCEVTVLTSNVSGRERILAKALKCSNQNPQLVLTTYGLVQSSKKAFMGNGDNGERWDYVVLDEAHTVKNAAAQTTLACRSLCRNPNTRRLMLTGTPIMNNLVELWTLFDWATSGRVLGPIQAFKDRFAKPIERARDKHATNRQIRIGQEVNEKLQNKLRPYFLQRLKVDYLKDQLPSKTDMVVWTHLSKEQRRRYSSYVKDDKNSIVSAIKSGEFGSVLEAITWLKMLSSHPILVDMRYKGEEMKNNGFKNALASVDLTEVVRDSAKLTIALDLVKELRRAGHRILVFSQSTRMLDILEVVFQANRIKPSRIDGSTKEKDRQRLVDGFNEAGGQYDVMLLSTKAAGVGLTLTGADRVILYDPSWNPATDSQAVDRAYRIGQKRPVLVYRMITAGTVEEKIYEKQIYKDGIRRTVFTECASIQRYFDRHELGRLFKLSEPGVCSVLTMMREETKDLYIDWGRHSFVTSHSSVVGVSLHDGLYMDDQKKVSDETDDSLPATPFAKLSSEATSRRHDASSLDLVPLESTPPPQKGKTERPELASGTVPPPGRAQRVLAEKNGDLAADGTKDFTLGVDDAEAKQSEDGDEDGYPKSPATTEVTTADASPKENILESAMSKAAPPLHEDSNVSSTPSFDLHCARELHRSGKTPRQSLKEKLNVLNSDEYQQLNPAGKVWLHESITAAASTTGLLK